MRTREARIIEEHYLALLEERKVIIEKKNDIIASQAREIVALEERAALAEMIITHGKAIVEMLKLGID